MEKSKKKMEKNKKQTGQVFLPPPPFFFFFERGLAACVVFPFWDLLFVCLFVFFFEFNGAIISMYLQIIGSK